MTTTSLDVSNSSLINNIKTRSYNPSLAPEILAPEEFPAVQEKINFFDLTLEKLKEVLQKYGKEKFRAQQIFSWVYQKGVTDFEQMTNLSKDLRAELPRIIEFKKLEMVSHLKSVDGTQKFLFKIETGQTFETVIIPSKDRLTLCVSSEVGCNMACKFCFTGKQKLKRRLSAGDVIQQFLLASSKLEGEQKLTNIVFMGMGEPLDNPDAVFNSIEILNSPWGMNFSRKRVTISTSGIVPGLKQIAESRARLAVSLNATTDAIRDEIMPINRKYNLEALMQGCREYYEITKDPITFEYVLLKDINDSLEDARRIKKLTKGIPSKINLIPFNEHPGSEFKRPAREKVLQFQEELMKMGLHVLIRRTMGRDIYAACGQLQSTYQGKPEKMSKDVMTTPEFTNLG